jgi:DMSO/TMAO reductase YedYZ molybdopterin-dependent catalytic subunit
MPTTSQRREFLRNTLAAVGAAIPFAQHMPTGFTPIVLAQAPAAPAAGDEGALLKTKEGLTILGDRPINAETPAHLLNDAVTPSERHYVRNHGFVPAPSVIDPAKWTVKIDGEVEQPLKLTIDQLRKEFQVVTRQIVLECAGNGRAFFNPPASGNQWTLGGIGCSKWTGVRLRDVLNKAKLKKSAVYTGHYGADVHLSRDPTKQALSRGVPIEKAMDEHCLIAFAMNGSDIPVLNGHPLRLLVPGWAGSCSQKWLTRIAIRDKVHDGEKMLPPAYCVPKKPVLPGTDASQIEWQMVSVMPVKSIITRPATGAQVSAANDVEIGGHAWVGEGLVKAVEISIDFGQTWREAEVEKPVNPYAWQHWSAKLKLPSAGYYEVWARATDEHGRQQPPVVPGWNPQGYLNNIQHRIGIFAV